MIILGITKRFIYLLAAGILVLLLSLFLNTSLTFFILYNLICAAALIIDYFISPKEELIAIERLGTESLSIYEKEPILISVYNKSDYKLNMELIDEIPDFHFKCDSKLMKTQIPPHEKQKLQYFVIPTKRGAYSFQSIHVKFRGRFGLCTKQFMLKLPREYKVYPNLKNLRKYRLSICNNRQFKQGQRSIKMLGRGTSFESLREYVPGDEYRKINWPATARGNKPIINQYEPEKNQHVHIMIDTGRPMGYTVRGHRKLDLAVNTALVLSDIVNQNGDKSALLLFNTEVNNMIMPGKGAGHRNKLLEALYHIESNKQTSNYEDAFYYFKKKERHRSIVFLFTDFDTLEEAEDILKVLPMISKNNLVVLILIRNEKLENISELNVKNTEDLFRKGVSIELLEERRKIISILNKRGVLCIECEAEKLEYTAINKYIQVKNKSYF